MRARLSLYNTLAAAFLQLVNMAVNFILPPLVVRMYGSQMNGLVGNTRLMIAYFNIVEAGLMLAATFALYKPLAARDDRAISGVVSAANRSYNRSGLAFTALVVAATFLYPLVVHEKGISSFTVGALVAIIGASGALEFFLVGKYKVLFTADQRGFIVSLINAFGLLVNAVILVAMMKAGFGMVWVQLAALGGFVLRSALYVLVGRSAYRHLSFRGEPDTHALDKRWESMFQQILGFVTATVPVILLPPLCGLEETSVYNTINLVFLSVTALLSVFNNGLSAVFGDMLARNEIAAMQRAYRQYELMYYAILTWGYACAAILIMPFLGLYTRGFTDAVYLRPDIAWLFVAVGLASNIKTPHGMLIGSAGLFRETRVQSMIQAGINVAVSVALTPMIGMAGVLCGALASHLYRDVEILFFIPKVVTKLPPVETFRRVGRLVVLFTLAVLPFVRFIRLTPQGWDAWFAEAVGAGVWAMLVVVGGNLLMERKNMLDTMDRFRMMLRRGAPTRRNGGNA